jgi:hypothetical protein
MDTVAMQLVVVDLGCRNGDLAATRVTAARWAAVELFA